MGDEVVVRFPAITAVHAFQHARIAVLRWHVDLLADIIMRLDRLDDVVAKVFGMWRREPYTHLGRCLRHCVEQVCKALAAVPERFVHALEASGVKIRKVVPRRIGLPGSARSFLEVGVRIDVLSEQPDFFGADVGKVSDFVKNARHRPRPLATSSSRHDAITAILIATSHDRHKDRYVTRRPDRGDVAVRFVNRQLHVHRLVHLAIAAWRRPDDVDEPGQVTICVRSNDQASHVVLQ
mmetsp:Transcript_2458/g.7569  ORF Transcript_2458/g.7569 Transcript_2458/m.7569 type:complete len:237 (-) Transcript_2458:548-1258(-)